MPRKQYKYHYIYKTTCLVNQRYYIGIHSTSNLGDGYLGSGKILKRSLNKYGIENHKLEILEMLEDRNSLKEREKEIVNEDILKDPMNMNLKIGGEGGLGFISVEQQAKRSSAGGLAAREKLIKLRKDPNWKEQTKLAQSNGLKKAIKDGRFSPITFTGRTHSDDAKKKIGLANSKYTGKANSSFGTCWIYNENESKKIKREDLSKYITNGWSKGRKMKF